MQEARLDLEVLADTVQRAGLVRRVAFEGCEQVDGVHDVDFARHRVVGEDMLDTLDGFEPVAFEVPMICWNE